MLVAQEALAKTASNNSPLGPLLGEGMEHSQGFFADVVLDPFGIILSHLLRYAKCHEEIHHNPVSFAAGFGQLAAFFRQADRTVGLLQDQAFPFQAVQVLGDRGRSAISTGRAAPFR